MKNGEKKTCIIAKKRILEIIEYINNKFTIYCPILLQKLVLDLVVLV